ncbi:MAG TPA: hypothetical protein VJN89_18450 [Candidatus Acidoferrum sp.]|nr:hypothetical protein [Candidatus Acidoferrum sp.]
MPCPPTQPPWEFLLSASRNSLQSYELSRLAHAANLRKEIGALIDQWVDESACAMLARWLIEQRERPPRVSEHGPGEGLFSSPGHSAPPCVPSSKQGSAPHSVSDNVFADRPVPSPEIRGPA